VFLPHRLKSSLIDSHQHPGSRQMKDPWELQKVLAQYTNEIPSENDFYLLLTEYTAGMQVCQVEISNGHEVSCSQNVFFANDALKYFSLI
jgi:transposase